MRGIEGFRITDAAVAWGARGRVTKAGWRFDKGDSAIVERLGNGALVRAEERSAVAGRYPADAVVCMVDEGELVVCVHSSGQEVGLAVFLRSASTPLPGAYYNGQEDFRRTIETSPWYESFRSGAGHDFAPSGDEPPMTFGDKGPQIFIHERARRALEDAFPVTYRLTVTDNRQTMISRQERPLGARLHMMFLDAPKPVQKALVRYVIDGGDTPAGITAYIRANGHRIRVSQPVAGLYARGKVHDLADLMSRLNETYFDGTIDGVRITWGRRAPRDAHHRSGVRLGSYSAPDGIIRIHPVLDAKRVPRYFVSYVVYHELLHHVIPPQTQGRRTLVHPPEFHRRERLFRQYARATAWESKHLSSILGSSVTFNFEGRAAALRSKR